MTLLSYVWPDQAERLHRLQAALDLAGRVEAPVDRAGADTWLAERLVAEDGVATIVQHSVFWWYLPAEAQERVAGTIQAAGAQATASSPIAWLRLEVADGEGNADLRLTTWPDREDRVLARTSAHPRRIAWLL